MRPHEFSKPSGESRPSSKDAKSKNARAMTARTRYPRASCAVSETLTPASVALSGSGTASIWARTVVLLRELDGLAPCRNCRGEAEGADLRLKRGLCCRVAVHAECLTRLLGEVAQPCEELGLVGMCGESADRTHLAMDLEVLTVDPDLFRPLLQARAEGAVALIADEEESHTWIADERLDVLDDPP